MKFYIDEFYETFVKPFQFSFNKTVLISSLYEELHKWPHSSEAAFPKYLSEQELFHTEVVVALDVPVHFFQKCQSFKGS